MMTIKNILSNKNLTILGNYKKLKVNEICWSINGYATIAGKCKDGQSIPRGHPAYLWQRLSGSPALWTRNLRILFWRYFPHLYVKIYCAMFQLFVFTNQILKCFIKDFSFHVCIALEEHRFNSWNFLSWLQKS